MIAHFKLIQMMLKHILIKVMDIKAFLGVALRNLGKYDKAIKMYDRAI